MGSGSVSQAAAVALRQLQSQLATAYADNAKLQEEQAAVRADARAEVDTRQAEVDAARSHSRDQAKQLSEMFAMLQDMKDALQSTADENGRLHERLAAEARKQDGLQAELAKSGSSLEALQADAAAAASSHARQLQDMDRQARHLQAQLHESQSHGSQAAAAHERCRVLSRELEAARQARCEAETATGQCETALTNVHRDLEARSKALQTLETEVLALRQTSAAHVRQLEEVQAAAHQAQAALTDEKSQKSGLSRALRKAEHSLTRVLSLNQSLVEAFTGIRPEQRRATAAAAVPQPLLSPPKGTRQETAAPRPARLEQAAYTSPLPSCRIDSPKRAGGTWNIQLDADAIGAHWQAPDDSSAGDPPLPRQPAHGRSAGPDATKATRMRRSLRPPPCSARVLELSAPKRGAASPGCPGDTVHNTNCHHHHCRDPCWHHKPRPSQPAAKAGCLHHDRSRPCCRATPSGMAKRPQRPKECCTPHGPSTALNKRTREQMQSVLMSLEDELGALDLRYADLLRRAQLGLDGASLDSADDSEFELIAAEPGVATRRKTVPAHLCVSW
ncbi:hypothetical protein WJX84_007286 [Apatococcus fuscideae]|uniref:Uncharacterized protein n=1 Tax=Apatococcus fuscideae TaxID=2026836 RepID=A0AAW1TJ40_9CHLO